VLQITSIKTNIMKSFTISPKWAVLSIVIAGLSVYHLYASSQMILSWTKGKENIEAITPATVDGSAQSIQVALILDTSNSMDGLIEQAKSQLWSILTTLSNTQKNGNAPNLEIALYEYGNDNIPMINGHVRQVLPFTTDMDEVSAALFALTTNGGNEYCAQVIQKAITDLKWDTHPNAMRLAFIAGNEAFNQGILPYQTACKLAKEQDIIVNTIFCGQCDEGVRIFWKDGADITGGNYGCINQNEATAYIETPYDGQLTVLNEQLNTTYIPYGQLGTEKQKMQRIQDTNASSYHKANAAERACFKATSNYRNASWDLVDAYKNDESVIADRKTLPKDLADKSEKEITECIQKAITKRSEIQQQINNLSEERTKYLEVKRKEMMKQGDQDLQSSIQQAIQKQASRKGFDTGC
jgi:hypothetical protein